jgi:hypothetical protein
MHKQSHLTFKWLEKKKLISFPDILLEAWYEPMGSRRQFFLLTQLWWFVCFLSSDYRGAAAADTDADADLLWEKNTVEWLADKLK